MSARLVGNKPSSTSPRLAYHTVVESPLYLLLVHITFTSLLMLDVCMHLVFMWFRRPSPVKEAVRVKGNLGRRGGDGATAGIATVGVSRGDPAKLWYCVTGPLDGPRVLCINGVARNAADSEPLQRFANQTLRVATYDARYVGLSEARSGQLFGRLTTTSLAEDALDMIHELGWMDNSRGVHVVGNSCGGMVLQELCMRTPPGLLRSASFVTTYSGGSLRSILPTLCFQPRTFSKKIAAHFSDSTRDIAEANLVVIGGRLEGLQYSEALEEQVRRAALYGFEMGGHVVTRGAMLRHMAAAAGHHLSARRLALLGSTRVPKHVFGASEFDMLVQHNNSPPLAAAIGAKLSMYDGFGHDLTLLGDGRRGTFLRDIFEFIQAAEDAGSLSDSNADSM